MLFMTQKTILEMRLKHKEDKMKIKKSQLRQIIKEEKLKLNEAIYEGSSGPLVTLCQAWSRMGNESLQGSVAGFIAADREGKFEELFNRGDVTFHAIDMAHKYLVPALEAVNDPEAKAMLDTIAKALKLRSGERGDREYSGAAKRRGY